MPDSSQKPEDIIIRSAPAWQRHSISAGFGLFLVLFCGLYFFIATHLVNQTNPNRQKHDQQNNIELTKVAATHLDADAEIGFAKSVWRWFPHHTDGVVNPLWPWIAARVAHKAGQEDEALFLRGKWTNIYMTAGFCVVLGLIALRYFSIGATINLMLLVGFGAMLPRAPYYQPEPLYFILFLLSWICCLGLLKKNSIWRYCLLGALAGTAYLAKTSVLPLLLAFVAVSTYRFLLGAVPAVVRKDYNRPASEWCWRTHIIGLFFLAVFFLMTAGPRLSYANEQYGKPFHSYPSYWMWMDDFESGYDFMADHPDKPSLRRIPSDEVPSASNYFKSHSAEQVTDRVAEGFWFVNENFFSPRRAANRDGEQDPWRQLLAGRGWYLAALLAIAAAFLIWQRFHKPAAEFPVQRLGPEWTLGALFVVGTLILYGLLFGWYMPIGKGDRFMLALYAPLAFSLIWAGEGLRQRFIARGGDILPLYVYHCAHGVLAAMILLRIWTVTASPSFYGR